MRRREILPVIILSFCLFSAGDVLAQSWWGDGVKSHDWILKHGGALVRFEIVNKSGEAWEYKTVMTRSGKNIEAEVGKQGIFDDAKPGKDKPVKYKVTFYRGGNGQKNFDNKGSEIKSITLDLHAGEFVTLKLDYSKKKISMRTDYQEQEEEPVVLPKTRVAQAPVEISKEILDKKNVEDSEEENAPAGDPAILPDSQENKTPVSASACYLEIPKLAAYNALDFGVCDEKLAASEVRLEPVAHSRVSPENAIHTEDIFDFFKSLLPFFDSLHSHLGMR